MTHNKIPNLVVVAFLTVITVIVWVGLEVFRTLSTKPTTEVSENISRPLDPNLDLDTLDKLQQRIYLDNLTGTTTLTIETPSPEPSPTSTPEISATPSATNQPTTSPVP